jgi:hypothetical protein
MIQDKAANQPQQNATDSHLVLLVGISWKASSWRKSLVVNTQSSLDMIAYLVFITSLAISRSDHPIEHKSKV